MWPKINYLYFIVILLTALVVFSAAAQENGAVPDPETFFGFKPGADRMLFTYEQLISYLQEVDGNSPRLKMVEIGESPLGRKMFIAFISDAQNIQNLENLKNINKKLALDYNLSDAERQQLVSDGRVFVLATLSMHSGEVAPSQSVPLIAFDLVTTTDPQKIAWLKDVVYMLVPCHNPDGMDMIVNHYNKYKGTKYEGSSMPGVYHKYVGHDNNRDFVILSQKDTKAIAAIYNLTWYPQVMVEKHQMGYTGPRYFVPPTHDPIAENVEAGIWNWSGVFGSNLIKHMTASGLSGISQHYIFDDYWPGSTETCIWKNVIGFLTEAASASYATPIYVEPNELRVYGKGLSEYKMSVNMPDLWPGGWWRLGDIVEYEVQSTMSIIETASLYRDKILYFRNDICKREVERGQTQAPYYYAFPIEQHDPGELVNLVHLLIEQGINVYQLSDGITFAANQFHKNDIVVPLAQPFRPFIKEVLETQEFPIRHYTPNGEVMKPYDITTWSLPLHRGVTSVELKERSTNLEALLQPIDNSFNLRSTRPEKFWAMIFPATNNESFFAAVQAIKSGEKVWRIEEDVLINEKNVPRGSFLINNLPQKLAENLTVEPIYILEEMALKKIPLKLPRIALVESYFHDMDAGWTRFIFDSYGVAYQVIHPGEFKNTDFENKYDVVIFPDEAKSILMEGKYKTDDDYTISSYPPEFTEGIGKDGMNKLMTFIDKGGLIISWGRSAQLFSGTLTIPLSKDTGEDFQLPFSDVSEKLQKEGLYCPGSLIGIKINQNHPLSYGLPAEIGVFYRGRPVFETSLPHFDMDRRVIAKFPEKDILISGYCENEKKLSDKSAMLWIKKGKGQFVLFAFNPQFRASTQVSYKLLFNAMLLKNYKL